MAAVNRWGRPARVGISGSYGGINLGDEAILHAIVAQLRELPVEITVFTRHPEDTLSRHGVARALEPRTLTRDEAREEVARLDLLVLGGGGILFDAGVEAYLREVGLAHELGVPVFVYAVSAGPLVEPTARALVRDTLNGASVITVRDRQGKRLLEEVGVKKDVQVTADPALLLEEEPLPEYALPREGITSGRRLVGFSVREPGPAAPGLDVDHYHKLVADAADFMVDRYDADVLFVPLEPQSRDLQHSHAVVSRMLSPQHASVLKQPFTSGQILTLMKRFEFAVGMRLHFLIFAARQRVPFVALPYASKVTSFIEDLEMAMPPLTKVDAGRLIAHIDRSWDFRDELRARIDRALHGLQARARETHQALVTLLEATMTAPDRKERDVCRR
jgi:polysaccharide pyruvyl transferase CsaB